MTTIYFDSPLGIVKISGEDTGVSMIACTDVPSADDQLNRSPDTKVPEPVRLAAEQIQAYLTGERQTFDFLINPAGTAFQQTVWRALLDVPFGTTVSYLTLTRRIGDEKAIRAVASANGRNPLWIVVPCHRVVGSDGSLTGYAGGLWRKKWLLEHERVLAGRETGRQLSLF